MLAVVSGGEGSTMNLFGPGRHIDEYVDGDGGNQFGLERQSGGHRRSLAVHRQRGGQHGPVGQQRFDFGNVDDHACPTADSSPMAAPTRPRGS